MRLMKLLGLTTIVVGLLAVPVAAQVEPYPPVGEPPPGGGAPGGGAPGGGAPGGGAPAGGCSLAMTSSVVPPGGTETVSTMHCATAFAPGAAVGHTLESTPVDVGTAIADANGRHSHTFTIPSSASPGSHTVRATGAAADGSTMSLTAAITVSGAAAPVRTGNIPFTGSGTTPAVWIALVALVLGAAMVIGARRRATVRDRQTVSS